MGLPSRRTVLAGVVSMAGLGSWFGWRNRFALELYLAFQQDSARPDLDPCEPGTLTDSERGSLWQLASTIAVHWSLEGLTRAEFDRVLDLKTTEAPSYLAEYRRALALLPSLTIDGVLEVLAAPRRLDGAFTEAAHVQSHVIEEFVRLLLARGGFRQFGITNHPGFAGGPNGFRQARSDAL